MLVNAATADALEYISARAADVDRAYTPGAHPSFGDVQTARADSRPAADPLCVAPPADAYFVTTDQRGRTAYTQDGSFHAENGRLAGSNGRAILGFSSPGAPLSELQVEPVDFTLGRAQHLRIEADGALTYDRSTLDPRNGSRSRDRVVVGYVALARFPAATKLIPSDGDRVTAPAGIVPHVGRPGDGNFAVLEPMRRETSRIDIDASLDRLNEAYMAFDALQAAHKAQGSLGKTAMDLLK